MKGLLLVLVGFVALPSFAVEQDYTCKLSQVVVDPSDIDGIDLGTIDGEFKVSPLGNGSYELKAKATIIQDDETNELEADDIANTVIVTDENSDPTLEEYLAMDEAMGAYLVKNLNGEKPVRVINYVGEQFKDDGAGLGLTQIIGDKGTKFGLVSLGWLPANCK
jgi:hypothetical protein